MAKPRIDDGTYKAFVRGDVEQDSTITLIIKGPSGSTRELLVTPGTLKGHDGLHAWLARELGIRVASVDQSELTLPNRTG